MKKILLVIKKRKAIFIILIFILIVWFYNYLIKVEYKKYGILLKGKVIEYIASTAQSSGGFKYEFYYKGEKKIGISTVEVYPYGIFFYKTFPVLYSKFSGRSVLLIGPRSFKRYGFQFPDSLKWVSPYLKVK